jgi:hypothetical protein
MSGAKQHFIPAAIIGGFGQPKGSVLRDAVMAVWRWGNPKRVFNKTAEKIGWLPNLYTLVDPQGGVSPDVVDTLWTKIEPSMLSSIRALANGAVTPDQEEALCYYIASSACRHPSFKDLVNEHRRKEGQSSASPDELLAYRVDSLQKTVAQVREWRWRVLVSPEDAQRFIGSDLGSAKFSTPEAPGSGIFFPLTPDIGVLGFIYDADRHLHYRPGFSERLILVPSAVRWLNAAVWRQRRPSQSLTRKVRSLMAGCPHPLYRSPGRPGSVDADLARTGPWLLGVAPLSGLALPLGYVSRRSRPLASTRP